MQQRFLILILAEIPNLDTSKITTGTLDAGRIDNASLANVTALPFSAGTDWQSTIVTGTTLTAEAGKGYWINTTSNACTITLPASASVGDTIEFSDYARTWGTNSITINQNSLNFQGYTSPNPEYNTSGQSVKIVYSGATQGWIPTVDDDVTMETPQVYSADILVVAGGGGGPTDNTHAHGGGGGAGGYRTSTQSFNEGQTYTITVGDGGPTSNLGSLNSKGSDSSISGSGLTTITSTGGGGGKNNANGNSDGGSGGAGGGPSPSNTGGSGNTPSTSPSQGNDGGNSNHTGGNYPTGGGGGAGAVGGNGRSGTSSGDQGGLGGDGLQSSITGTATYYAGGGGGGCYPDGPGDSGNGGLGGGGRGGSSANATAGTVNTGGGGGGANGNGGHNGGAGGKGVVILSIPDANYSGTTTGSPTVATGVSGKTILTFTGSGSYTA
jgi:hypothetical protein